jgi:hypothetical protein
MQERRIESHDVRYGDMYTSRGNRLMSATGIVKDPTQDGETSLKKVE